MKSLDGHRPYIKRLTDFFDDVAKDHWPGLQYVPNNSELETNCAQCSEQRLHNGKQTIESAHSDHHHVLLPFADQTCISFAASLSTEERHLKSADYNVFHVSR